MIVGRFAPSPTGPLHIGSLVAAVGSYAIAKRAGGRWLVRMEDLDTLRIVPGSADDILRTLESLGFEWDDTVVRQSERSRLYQQALDILVTAGSAYPCGCSRAEIARASSAPHDGEHETVYPGTCREGLLPGRSARAWRVRVPDGNICFDDIILGRCSFCLRSACGDFIIKRADGLFAYQLAVVLDDELQGVNQVVRGSDLLSSTPRQIHLQNLLGFTRPEYCHLPLVTAADGGKLSKRNNVVSRSLLCQTPTDGSGLLFQSLTFLGQKPPVELQKLSPPEILNWASQNFDTGKVPKTDGSLQLDVR